MRMEKLAESLPAMIKLYLNLKCAKNTTKNKNPSQNMMSNKYLEVLAATRAGVGSREDRNNAWPQCQRRKRNTGPDQRGRAPSSLDTSGLQRPSGGEHPTEQRHIRGDVKLKTPIASNRATLYKRRTHSRDRDSQIHHDARFGACTQGVAADEIDGSRRGHVELALCRLRHQQERNPSRAREPRQVAHLRTHAVTASSVASRLKCNTVKHQPQPRRSAALSAAAR